MSTLLALSEGNSCRSVFAAFDGSRQWPALSESPDLSHSLFEPGPLRMSLTILAFVRGCAGAACCEVAYPGGPRVHVTWSLRPTHFMTVPRIIGRTGDPVPLSKPKVG